MGRKLVNSSANTIGASGLAGGKNRTFAASSDGGNNFKSLLTRQVTLSTGVSRSAWHFAMKRAEDVPESATRVSNLPIRADVFTCH